MGSTTEWDVLKRHHQFVREGEDANDVSWEERLARAYESKMFKEYALVDLKHYKSKQFALRWRTATEVVQGVGEDTCGSLRCQYHPSPPQNVHSPVLTAFELPFVYDEQGRRKEALVKVRLCRKCADKLTWKPRDRDKTNNDRDQDKDDSDDKRRHRRRSSSPERRHASLRRRSDRDDSRRAHQRG